jgi:hypothetical protein
MAYTTIDDPSAYFQTTIYTGDGSTSHAITNGGNSDLQPDWLWIKSRSSTEQHFAFDSVRGQSKYIFPNATNAEGTAGTGILNSFNSDGFTLGNNDGVNADSETFVAWNWKAGTTSGITTTNSTITPAGYSFNQTAGFSIIKYPGNGTNDAKCPHGLGVAPQMIFIKDLDNAADWECYNEFNGNGKVFHLNKTNGADATSARWRNTSPDAVNWTMGSTTAVNGSGRNYVAYCFAGKQGYSKFGSYTGNGNADGTFIYTGFLPSFVMVKQTNASGEGWHILDNKRSGVNGDMERLLANSSNAESNYAGNLDLLSNGFKTRINDAGVNGSGASYIYMAYAQQPFVTGSSGVPATAR